MAESAENGVRYRHERRRFALISYVLTAVSLLLAFAQWCIIYFINVIKLFFMRNSWEGSILFVIGLLVLVLFILFEGLRFNTKINWIFAVLIFECVVLGVAPLVARQLLFPFLLSFAVWTLALIVFIICGSLLPFDLTLNIVVLFVLAVTAIIGAIFFMMLYIVINVPYSFFIVCSFIVISIWMFVMYHAQIINGGRFAEMRSKDYYLAALILFLDFLFMYLFSFYFAPKWSDYCRTTSNSTHRICK